MQPHQNCSVSESSNNSSFRGSASGSSTLPSSMRNKKRPVENGGPHGMCKAGEHLQSCVSTIPSQTPVHRDATVL